MKLGLALVAAVLLAGCGESSPTAPSTTSSPSSGGVPFTLALQTNGVGVTFRATLNGQTYTANGQFQQRLAPGTYTLSGSFTPTGQNVGEGLIVAFLTAGGTGGVRSGSVRSSAGPLITTGLCSVGYALLDATRSAQNFQLQFEVTTNQNSACQYGA